MCCLPASLWLFRDVRATSRAMLSLLEIAALLLVLSALFGWINARFVRLPPTIALLLMALLASLVLMAVDALVPSSNMRESFTSAIAQIDFFDTLMRGMLAFLLFAGALQVDLSELRDVRWPVGILATFFAGRINEEQ